MSEKQGETPSISTAKGHGNAMAGHVVVKATRRGGVVIRIDATGHAHVVALLFGPEADFYQAGDAILNRVE